MFITQESNRNEQVQTPPVVNRADQIKEFFERDLINGYNISDSTEQTSFPRLTLKLQDEAISKKYLDYDKKDKIIKDPNALSIFFIQFNPDSPRTEQSLESLGLEKNHLQVFVK